MSQQENIHDAKKSLKSHIKFFESILKHLNGDDPILLARSMWTAWCLNQYINDGLMRDIERAITEHQDDTIPITSTHDI